jgi:phosphoribosylanthranilate isomerase
MAITAKICGLSEPSSLEAALKHGADMVGFVFFPKSPRNVSVETAAALASRVPAERASTPTTICWRACWPRCRSV